MSNTLKITKVDAGLRVTIVSEGERDQSAVTTYDELQQLVKDAESPEQSDA